MSIKRSLQDSGKDDAVEDALKVNAALSGGSERAALESGCSLYCTSASQKLSPRCITRSSSWLQFRPEVKPIGRGWGFVGGARYS